MVWLIPPVTMVLWMVGGQIAKGARRYGVPGFSMVVLLYRLWMVNTDDKKSSRRYFWIMLGVLLTLPVLSMGYGMDSWLKKICKKEWTTRLIYAIMLSVPLGTIGTITHQTLWEIILIPTLNIAAFQIRAGSLFTVGRFDVLIEDMVRSLAFSAGIVLLITG